MNWEINKQCYQSESGDGGGERLKEIQLKVYIVSVSHVICCKVTVAILKDCIEDG